MTPTLEAGVRYVVTKGSDDGTLEIGEHVWLDSQGCLCSREGQGWIDPPDLDEVLQGVEVVIDDQWYKSRISKLTKELERLASMKQ